MMHPATELRFISEDVGCGVFAKGYIPRGTITWCLDDLDQHFTPEAVARMHPMSKAAVEKYRYVTSDGISVLCWDHARFINHSCDPNCLSGGFDFDFEFAIRDVNSGEQLTDEYSVHNLTKPMDCRCQARNCRGRIDPDDWSSQAERVDTLVAEAAPYILRVDQPLWPLMGDTAELLAVLTREAGIPSVMRHRLLARDC
jgi:uncharacterized protein